MKAIYNADYQCYVSTVRKRVISGVSEGIIQTVPGSGEEAQFNWPGYISVSGGIKGEKYSGFILNKQKY